MIRHPGGLEQTRQLLALYELRPPAEVLDLGAGDGETVQLLRNLGFTAHGVDRRPGPGIMEGDFWQTTYEDATFDALISECALFASGDRGRALSEAARLLREDGIFFYADVWFDTEGEMRRLLEEKGFSVEAVSDATPRWQEYYLRCLWEGRRISLPCGIPKGKCFYRLLVCRKKRACVSGQKVL